MSADPTIDQPAAAGAARAPSAVLRRPVVLVGLMGAGKSSIGKRLAQRLSVAFVDADEEIEKAAGMTISEIFERHGESVFRDGERRVIARILAGPVGVMATGGGAFMDPATRVLIRDKAVSIWLRAELDVLLKRVLRRSNRPLLRNGDPREILTRLMAERHPVYGEADITVETGEGPHDAVIDRIVAALTARGALP